MTAVKICGIKSFADALAAVEAGADYLGFNFYPKSARFIQPEACARIAAVLKAEHPSIRLVGVFVNAPLVDVQATLRDCRLDLAQLHGDEPAEMVARLAPHAFKAFRGIPGNLEDYLRTEPPACLIDAAVQGAYGGTGIAADWLAAARIAQRFPVFLAGGLNPGNAAEAVRQVRPWGVDAASGVETGPGVKDAVKMRAFVEAVRSVTASEQVPHTGELEKR
jgi:phosphoribosylanthranilate isomerase